MNTEPSAQQAAEFQAPPIVTHLSIANAWECDDNHHLNARFYADRFQQASAVFRAKYGLSTTLNGARSLSYRFHREVRQSQILAIETTRVSGSPFGTVLGHRLIEPSSRRLFATALDCHDWQANLELGPIRRFEPGTDAMLARLAGDRPPQVLADAIAHGGIASGTGMVGATDIDNDGNCLDRVHVGYFSDGAAIVWHAVGLGEDRLRDERWGRMVVDLSIRRVRPATAGQTLEQRSGIYTSRSRTLVMRHDQFDTVTGLLVASSLATGMLVSLETRRAVAFPAEVRRLASGS